MSFKKFGVWLFMLLLICIPGVNTNASDSPANGGNPSPSEFAQAAGPEFDVITAEELKAKVEKNERITIIDVRSSSHYASTDNTIKGAIHVKLRRLESRLAFPPLKDAPRDREVVTYCACPNDEASIKAAQVLKEAGFKRVRVLKGGWNLWLKANGPVEPRPRG